MSEQPKRIDITEFRESGFLQEVNRRFFHPLGLALEVLCHNDGSETLGGIWDYRDDPEGMLYESSAISTDKIDYVESLLKSKLTARKQTGDCDDNGTQMPNRCAVATEVRDE